MMMPSVDHKEKTMSNHKIPWGSWVLVCDGQKGMILRNDGDADLLNLKPIEVRLQPHAKSAELGTDAPGRSFQSHGASRSAVQATDFHEAAKAEFLKELTQELDVAASEKKFKHLVIVAPPHALGIIRENLTPAARALIVTEIHKDLTHLEIAEIERHLADG
jgi:protein required for attachment to host cells